MAALHDMPADTEDQVACYCCDRSVEDSDLVRFHKHPQHGVCIGCAAWLHKRSLSMVHEIHPPFWWRLTPNRFHGD